MKHSIQKFQVKIIIDDEDHSDFMQLKQKILQYGLKYDGQDILIRYQNEIQQIVVDRAKRTAMKNGCLAYIADYEERQGSFEFIFVLIIESIITYAHLRHFAEIITEDIVILFKNNRQLTVRSELKDVPDPVNEEVHQNFSAKPNGLIIICVCLAAALLFFIIRFVTEKEENKPTEIFIKTEGAQPLIKGLDNIVIYKDTFRLKSADSLPKH